MIFFTLLHSHIYHVPAATGIFFESTESSKSTLPEEIVLCEGPDEVRCEICKDPVEKVYNDDIEDWMLKAAVKVGDLVYHRACYSAAKANSLAQTR